MTMVCDRCGETYTLEEWNKWNEMNGKIEVRPIIGGKEGWSILLCPSCMAKLNDWLKGEQERQAKWIYDMKETQSSVTSAEQNTNSRRMNVYRILIVALTVVQEWRE